MLRPRTEAAEVPFTAFTGRRKAEQVALRLLGRRVKRAPAARGWRQGRRRTTRPRAGIMGSSPTSVWACS